MKGLFLIVLIQILLLGSLVSSLDATKLTIDYNKENCVNFYPWYNKYKICLRKLLIL